MVFPMQDAPTEEGSRVLIKTKTYRFSTARYEYFEDGTKWVEAIRVEGKWRVWCGNPKISTTEGLSPIAWHPLPEE